MKPITWTTTEPTTIPAGEMLIAISDGTIRYYGTCNRQRTVLGIGRAFARGFDHGESMGLVTASIERRVGGGAGRFFGAGPVQWTTLGRVTFGPAQPVALA